MNPKTLNLNDPKNILPRIEKIALAVKQHGIILPDGEDIREAIDDISLFFRCSDIQGKLLSVIFSLNLSGDYVTLSDIARVCKVEPMQLISYMNDLEQLQKLNLIRQSPDRQNSNSAFGNISFYIPHFTIGIINGRVGTDKKSDAIDSVVEFLESFHELVEDLSDSAITRKDLQQGLDHLMSRGAGLTMVKNLNSAIKEKTDTILFLHVAYDTASGNGEVNFYRALDNLYESVYERYAIKRRMINGTSPLITMGLMEFRETIFQDDKTIHLTEMGLSWVNGEEINMVTKKDHSQFMILPENINATTLYLQRSETQEINFLTRMLMPDEFGRMQKRMKENGMPTGFAVLFHGMPGTGKTECAKQLARNTGRAIMMVDISGSRSKWYGESEKLTKAIFKNYREQVNRSKIAPVLVIDEADAIFIKRRDVGDSHSGFTENMLANIVLQELEDLNGILIATTNLIVNFDGAFMRRFLYKICFNAPDINARMSIWKEKIPALPARISRSLSEQFALSGGQIDNVARRYLMKQVIDDENPTPDDLRTWCLAEKMDHEIQKIGF